MIKCSQGLSLQKLGTSIAMRCHLVAQQHAGFSATTVCTVEAKKENKNGATPYDADDDAEPVCEMIV
jgi:hypothetical protein